MTRSGWVRAVIVPGGLLVAAGCADSPTADSGPGFAAVTASGAHSCAITRSGAVSCWGANYFGQLGNGSTSNSEVPQPLAGGRQLLSVAAGYEHSCATSADGEAFCWGDNTTGQLGSGMQAGSTTPVVVIGGNVYRAVATGAGHTCALNASGRAVCWGSNHASQLGDGSQTTRATPLPVSGGLAFAAIGAGGYHTCALDPDGVAYCWGDNSLGELGTGAQTAPVAVPVPVSGGLRFRQLSAGYRFNCGLADDGAVWCWGDDVSGQLGVGGSPERCTAAQYPCSTVPRQVLGDARFQSVSAGGYHACAVATSGVTYCWGDDTSGQLGAEAPPGLCYTQRSCATSPIQVGGTVAFGSVSAGYQHTCAVADGALYCWGENASGQLGDGSRTKRSTPTRVAGQP